jgi:CubicO group peptidase (beta-lactamase class C family)
MHKLGGSTTIAWIAGLLLLSFQVPAYADKGAWQLTLEQVNQAVDEIKKLCQTEVDHNTVPGIAISVVFQDKVVCAAGFGVRDVDGREPVNADTVFQLASLSKPIGATVAAALIGKGKISWDSKISDLDPDFAMYDPWVTREITSGSRCSQGVRHDLGERIRHAIVRTTSSERLR